MPQALFTFMEPVHRCLHMPILLHIAKKEPLLRAVRHSEKPVLNDPFSSILHKKFPKCVSIPGILLFVLKKSYHFKTASHL